MESQLLKIDAHGKYCKFPGVTIVSAIRSKDTKIWKELYDKLNQCELLKKHYSPLPFESYHMTTNDIYTQKRDGGSNWKDFITKDMSRLQQLFKTLSEKKFNPEIVIDSVRVGGVIMLELKIKEEQENIIRTISKEFDLERKIPPVFHITLGYSFNESSPETEKEIKKTIRRDFKRIF